MISEFYAKYVVIPVCIAVAAAVVVILVRCGLL